MASDNKKAKADPAPKSEAAAKDKSTAGEAVSKTEGGEAAAAAPSNYSRGEGQKPVTTAYKENWNAIYAKKKKKARNKSRAFVISVEDGLSSPCRPCHRQA